MRTEQSQGRRDEQDIQRPEGALEADPQISQSSDPLSLRECQTNIPRSLDMSIARVIG